MSLVRWFWLKATSSTFEAAGTGCVARPESAAASLTRIATRSPMPGGSRPKRMPHIGAEKAAEATGSPRISARRPMQPPMECASRCQGCGRPSAVAASTSAATSSW